MTPAQGALLEGCELCYFGVKTIKQKPSEQALLREMIRLVMALIRHYKPQVLAIEKTDHIQHHAALLHLVAATLKSTAQEQGLTVYEYDPAMVRQLICQRQDAFKSERPNV